MGLCSAVPGGGHDAPTARRYSTPPPPSPPYVLARGVSGLCTPACPRVIMPPWPPIRSWYASHMADAARLTDERLRSWLDTNQLARERLCLSLLSIDGRYKNVRPRQPRGGPDGGCDIEASLESGEVVWAAVGFRNSVSDSPTDRRWAARKFKDDLSIAAAAIPKPSSFVFMTNVSVSVSQRNSLILQARHAGILDCQVMDRERLRILLDSPDGLSFRFQYLGIPLSDAEQAAFFSRWGGRIESTIQSVASHLDSRLDRLQFILERSRPLGHVAFGLGFKDGFSLAPGAHFRAFLMIFIPGSHKNHQRLELATCNEAPSRVSSPLGSTHARILRHFATATLMPKEQDDARKTITSGTARWDTPMNSIYVEGGFGHWLFQSSPYVLADLDNAMMALWLNKSLADSISRVQVFANEYELLDANRDQLITETPRTPSFSPWAFTNAELQEPWQQVILAHGGPMFQFSDETPKRR